MKPVFWRAGQVYRYKIFLIIFLTLVAKLGKLSQAGNGNRKPNPEAMTKSETNLIECLILNKRWETGSLDKSRRRKLILEMIDKKYIDSNLRVTEKGHAEYLNSI